MTDIVGIFDDPAQARTSAKQLIAERIASHKSIEIVESDRDEGLAAALTQVSTARVLIAFVIAACVTLLLAFATVAVDGAAFALAAVALVASFTLKPGGSTALLKHPGQVKAGRAVLIVSVADEAAGRAMDLLKKHGAVEASPQ